MLYIMIVMGLILYILVLRMVLAPTNEMRKMQTHMRSARARENKVVRIRLK